MPAARFWRAVGVESYFGEGLELSELHLYDAGGRVDASATLTCTHTPVAGVLANVNDDDTATTARWTERSSSSPGFALMWDFGAGVTKNCTSVRVGSSADQARFLAGLTLEYFDGSAWLPMGDFNRVPWPGASALGVLHFPAATTKTKFWRLLIQSNNGDAYTSLQEVQLFAGGTNVSQGCITDQSSYYGSNTAARAVDGNTYEFSDSVWVSNTGAPAPHWLSFQLASDTELSSIALWPQARSDLVARAPKSFVLQFGPSNSGPWTDLLTETNATGWTANVAKTWAVPSLASTLVPKKLHTVQHFLDTFAGWRTPGGAQAAPTGLQTSYRDFEFGGRCAVVGFTKIKGEPNTPFRCRVRLLRDRDALLVRETWSDAATGAFIFEGLSEAYTYTAYAQDHTGNYRAVVADRITPEVPA